MGDFVFRLARGVELTAQAGEYYLISRTPIRYLRLNRSLHDLVHYLAGGASLLELLKGKNDALQKKLVETVLTLVNKGFLDMEMLPDRGDDGELPAVSIIIPVRDRPEEISACLQSLQGLNYPREKMEVIVVDDGSSDHTAAIAATFSIKLIGNEKSLGPAACRNRGAEMAKGDILAFLDSDCLASPDWLRQIAPCFCLPGIGGIGGFVAGYYQKTAVDRYEGAFSSLNMGQRLLFDQDDASSFYVPSCNLFVRNAVFREVNGFQPQLQVGEDVDFCWRMRQSGHHLLYLPQGVVYHKHRSRLVRMLGRRFDYGTSEANLYRSHPEKQKKFPLPISGALVCLLLAASLISYSSLPLLPAVVLLFWDILQKKKDLAPTGQDSGVLSLAGATVRSLFALYYYLSFHLIRYYFLPMLMMSLIFPRLGLLTLTAVLVSAYVDYRKKAPRLGFPIFLGIYLLEHSAYQCGVFAGCWRNKYFTCYRLRWQFSRGG